MPDLFVRSEANSCCAVDETAAQSVHICRTMRQIMAGHVDFTNVRHPDRRRQNSPVQGDRSSHDTLPQSPGLNQLGDSTRLCLEPPPNMSMVSGKLDLHQTCSSFHRRLERVIAAGGTDGSTRRNRGWADPPFLLCTWRSSGASMRHGALRRRLINSGCPLGRRPIGLPIIVTVERKKKLSQPTVKLDNVKHL